MTGRTTRLLGPLLLSAVITAGCQGSASVKISFENRAGGQAGQALTLAGAGRTPAVFGIRLVAAYVAGDEDEQMNNVGEVGRIWTNPVCDPDLYKCGIGPGAGANRVTEYFDLALPTDEVNARLNAQGNSIKPGSYRLLRLDLAGPQGAHDGDVPNMRYGMAGATPVEVRRDNVYVVKLDPPLELADGDGVTLSLGYDVRDSYYEGDDLRSGQPPEGYQLNDWYCDEHGGIGRSPCLAFRGFFPSVTRTK
jgi:hypothetical protein